MTDHETKLHQLQSLIEQLPPVNKETLKRMINHLLKYVMTDYTNTIITIMEDNYTVIIFYFVHKIFHVKNFSVE